MDGAVSVGKRVAAGSALCRPVMDIITHVSVQETDDVIQCSLGWLVGDVRQDDTLTEEHSDIAQQRVHGSNSEQKLVLGASRLEAGQERIDDTLWLPSRSESYGIGHVRETE